MNPINRDYPKILPFPQNQFLLPSFTKRFRMKMTDDSIAGLINFAGAGFGELAHRINRIGCIY